MPLDPPAVIRRRVLVTGLVQGVFFRASCATAARNEGVSGWVRNRSDGRVEAVFEGPPGAVQRMIAWCGDGPPHARVTAVEVVDETPTGEIGFSSGR